MIIAVDGPAASGKGTVSRRLSERFNLAFLDTGLIYRAATKNVLQKKISPFNMNAVIDEIKKFDLREIFGNDLRTPEISSTAPLIAKIAEVREILNQTQRDFAHNPPPGRHGTVLDGRDIGTTICPDADVKLFVTANLKTRAGRRYKELVSQGVKTSFQAVHRDLRRRDEEDASRSASPLRMAEDAIVLDTTDMSIEEAVTAAFAAVEAKTGTSRPGSAE
ncbi:MAG TPA: (d)CMP kinase [Stellaceae bacterium]|jgi:cytidylate kinase|nr:(d)CMP kinase [Stellaceae bacterium]